MRHRAKKSIRKTSGPDARRLASLGVVALLLLAFFALAPSADALTTRPFKEVFGSAEQPTVKGGADVAVDVKSGDVLATTEEGGVVSIRRFHADGTPAPFSRLGTNVIDGREENGKPCAEEPASCDQTPNNGLEPPPYLTQIAVDESGGATAGDIYLSENLREEFGLVSAGVVDIFAPDGTYLGRLTGPREGEEFANVDGVAVDQSGAVFVSSGLRGSGDYITKFVPTANPVVNSDGVFSFRRPVATRTDEFGNVAVGAGPTAGSVFMLGLRRDGEVRENTVFQFDGASGEFERTFGSGAGGIGVDPNTGTVLVASGGRQISEYEAVPTSEPKKVGRVFNQNGGLGGFGLNDASEVIVHEGTGLSVYGTPAPVATVTIEPATGVTGTRATLSGTINPNELPLSECFFEYGERETEGKFPHEAECEAIPPTDSSPHRVQAEISGLEPNGHTYRFRLVAVDTNGQEESPVETLTTAATVVTAPAAAISTTGATLNGVLRPEGEEFTSCTFEYGVNTNAGFERRVPCIPGTSEIPPGFSPQSVSVPLTGLQAATTYRYRLIATSPGQGTREGEELTFTTQGAPRITEVRALDASQGSVTLEGKVNPSGSGTSYRFEWGPTSSYGNRTPAEFEPYLGTGEMPVRVSVQISGLSAGSTYHYRIVASSGAGIVASPDHVLETLNACGLVEGRCFELVSRSEAGPIAIPGENFGNAELRYQADPRGGALAYEVESGYPEARRGAEVLYRAVHGPEGWRSTELSTPFVAPSERNEGGSEVGNIQWLSNDLSCGFASSSQPLTDDPAARQVIEAGGQNFYRRNPDDTWTAVSKLAPENLEAETGGVEYTFDGASQDCRKVVFRTPYRYPGVPAASGAKSFTYEWEEGTLRNLGGEVSGKGQNVVSEDGSRVFFEKGHQVFVREDGSVDRELSASQTATADTGATYQWATADGSKVFFTANAGLTTETSGEGKPEGTDLYEYDLETEELTDRTVAHVKGGAQVAGFVGASKDGSVVYFGSPAQLLPGRGPTLAKNQKAGSFSIYRESAGEFKFIGTSSDAEQVFVSASSWTSEVSPDGRYLLFQSPLDVTGYSSGGASEAYLYDAEGGPEGTTTCVSCRQDGLPSLAESRYQVLPRNGSPLAGLTRQPQFLVEREGRPEVFFSSPDALAPDAVAGQNNVYEWAHDQVYRLTGAAAGTQDRPTANGYAVFVGAGEDGTDVYVLSPENLSWEDGDGRLSVFDARIGGGNPEPPPPVPSCTPSVEGSCQGAPQGAPATPGAATTGDSGDQNFEATKKKNPPRKHKKKGKKHKKGGKHKKNKKKSGKKNKNKKQRKSARKANSDRRAGK